MLGPGAVAILSVPTKLMELVEIPLRSFVGTGMSSMATAFNQKNMRQVTHIMNKYAGMLTWVFIPVAIGVFFLADIPVDILSSGKYKGTEAANLYRIVMAVAILYPIDRFNGIALEIIHQPRINFIKVQIMLFVKVVATFGCIALLRNSYGASFSIYGAPIGGFLTVLAGLGFGYYSLKKFMDFSIADILKTGYSELGILAKKAIGRA
jgi:O-antigen/teichoic acid export membrane protein